MRFEISILEEGTANSSISIHDEFTNMTTFPEVFSSWGHPYWLCFNFDAANIVSLILNNEINRLDRLFVPDLYDLSSTAKLNENHPAWKYYQQCLIQQIEEDMNSVPVGHFISAADKIFSDDKYTELTALQRYFAYTRAVLPTKTLTLRPVMSVDYDGFFIGNIKSDDSQNRFSDLLFSWQENSITSSEDRYDQLCKLLLECSGMHPVAHYTFSSFSDVFLFYFFEMIKENRLLKRCKNCGKFFAPKRKNSIYCDDPSPANAQKTCQEYVKYQRYLDKLHVESSRLYKQIYNQKANKVRRTENSLLISDLEQFKAAAEQWRSDVSSGRRQDSEYIEWLTAIKEKKVL